MKNKRRKFTIDFKAKVVLESLTERMPLHELANKYDVHPNVISNWKREFMQKAASVFEGENRSASMPDDKELEKLYAQIGKLKVENDFLKKVSTMLKG